MTFVDDLDPEKFLVAGDWHSSGAQAGAAVRQAEDLGIKTIVHVGDFGIWPGYGKKFVERLNDELTKRDMRLLFVDGNHEDFDTLLAIPVESDGHRVVTDRITHLPRAFRWTWGGLVMGALGGAHSVDQQWRTPHTDWWEQEWVSDAELDAFRAGGELDVVFMHDSPAGAPNEITDDEKSQRDAYHRFGPFAMYRAAEHRERLGAAVDVTDPSMIFHGHYHRRMESTYSRDGGRTCRVIGLDQGGSVYKNTYLFDTVVELPLAGRNYTNA